MDVAVGFEGVSGEKKKGQRVQTKRAVRVFIYWLYPHGCLLGPRRSLPPLRLAAVAASSYRRRTPRRLDKEAPLRSAVARIQPLRQSRQKQCPHFLKHFRIPGASQRCSWQAPQRSSSSSSSLIETVVGATSAIATWPELEQEDKDGDEYKDELTEVQYPRCSSSACASCAGLLSCIGSPCFSPGTRPSPCPCRLGLCGSAHCSVSTSRSCSTV